MTLSRHATLGFSLLFVLLASPMPRVARGADASEGAQAALEKEVTQGALRVIKDGGVIECPLKHTDVEADISGFVSRVRLTQVFHNPTKERIEAVYVFPLPHEAAVDRMTMVIGDRKISGAIKRRAEARAVYEQALRAGQTAALLEQERPNIFTQSAGNIEPGQEVRIEISYVDVLRYDLGTYEFQFPMVVGPRYIPGDPTSSPAVTPKQLQGKVSPPVPNTTRVPDAERITPPVLKPGVRNGHDISLRVTINSGVPIQDLKVANHQARTERQDDRRAEVELSPNDSIPNKDFVLRYGVVGKKPELALLSHTGNYSPDARVLGNGYFMLMIQPKEDDRLLKSPPREIVFLVDVSGSMSGEPTAKVIDAMQHMLKLCREQDTVQVITFASHAQKLFDKPVKVNRENIDRALNFTSGLRGSGGTEMLKGVKLAIDEPIDAERLRIVVMLTDGYIGNEAEIIEHVGKNCGDKVRFWCIGIGQSPNMFLVDGVAKQGGGMGKQLGLNDDSSAMTQEIMTRIQRAQLAGVKIDWGQARIAETYPAKIPELWAGRPIIVFGRFASGGVPSKIMVSGMAEGEPIQWPLEVTLPATEAGNDVLAKVWARKKVEDLMQQSFYGGSPAVEEEVTAIALDYSLMSQYTSFVAVDESKGDKSSEVPNLPRRMLVPVPLPEGTRWEGFFGNEMDGEVFATDLAASAGPAASASVSKPIRGRVLASAGGARLSRATPANQNLYFRQARGGAGALSGGGAPTDGRMVRGFGGNRPALGFEPAFAFSAKAASGPRVNYQTRFGRAGGRRLAESESLRQKSGLAKRELADLSVVAEDKAISAEEATYGVMQARANELSQAAGQAFEKAKKLKEEDKLAEAQFEMTRSYFLSLAAGDVAAHISQQSLTALKEVRDERVTQWTKAMPDLESRLDFVLRDVSVEDAVHQIAKTTGANLSFVAGSDADAAHLSGESELRVSYLDLRHATLAQALDWLLLPVRLTWQVSDGSIVVGSDRRVNNRSGWIYDVHAICVPSKSELEKIAEDKRPEAIQKSIDEFLKVCQGELKPASANDLVWFGPGLLLVVGSIKEQANASQLFTKLADPDAKLAASLSKLHGLTSKRAVARRESLQKLDSRVALYKVAQSHDFFGWRLLSAAAAGKSDMEALTELQIAWRQPQTEEMLKGNAATIVLRSLWLLTEASRALPEDRELAKLAASAVAKCRSAADAALEKLEKEPSNVGAFHQTLFAALVYRDDADYSRRARVLITKAGESDPSLGLRAMLIANLLRPVAEIDHRRLTQALKEGVGDDEDAIALLAMACRRAGGEAWESLRAGRAQLTGQPISDDIVVLVNRLELGQLAVTH